MATIGSFTASGNGFSGTIKTLNLNVKATIRAVERTSEKGPDYRILAGATEFGAAWKKTSNEGRDYLWICSASCEIWVIWLLTCSADLPTSEISSVLLAICVHSVAWPVTPPA
jgi:uncharacterized protein (DUF736 family)